MMDICMVVHKNYEYFRLQVDHWRSWIKGQWRLLVLDNTPEEFAQELVSDGDDVVVVTARGKLGEFDGVSHGEAMDFLVRRADTPIVGIIDSDFFWLDPGIIAHVEERFSSGVRVLGASCSYDDFDRYVDPYYPERRSNLAPALWGMFVDRRLAIEQTFVSTKEEGRRILAESGWRLRQRIISQHIPSEIYQRVKYSYGLFGDRDVCPYIYDGKIIGVHMLKGSMHRFDRSKLVPRVLDWGRGFWQ